MALDPALRAIVTICILVFSAKVLGEIFSWRKIPSVLGELLAGIVLGPYALGSLITVGGSPVIEINEIVRAFGEIGGILILFVAGLEMTFRDFRRIGLGCFVVGGLGVVVPFIMGYGITVAFGFDVITCLVIAAALTATSISITALVLQELNKTRKEEAKVMISAAVVDDVLGLSILGVIVSFITTSQVMSPFNIITVILTSLGLWFGITVFAAIILPKIINFTSKGTTATLEAAATASCFGASALAAYIGLSPIVGSFAAGMGIASTESAEKIREYARKISIIFSPVFFALAGAAFDIKAFFTLDWFFYAFFISLIIVAIVSKLVGCGIPAAFFLKNRIKGFRVGCGMISRGEVGLIVAGVAISAGAITQSTYALILGMIMITTVIAPLLLRKSFEGMETDDDRLDQEENDNSEYIPLAER